MPSRRTVYLDVDTLLAFDRQMNISLLITPMRAKLIMDNIDIIRDFQAETTELIDVERENRIERFRQSQEGLELP